MKNSIDFISVFTTPLRTSQYTHIQSFSFSEEIKQQQKQQSMFVAR